MFNPNDTILAGQSRETLQLWLTQAQNAYMLLVTGGKPQVVSYDGKSVSYTVADQAALVQWIGLLKRQLGIGRGRRALTPFYR
jgi:hypothetical protein